MVYGRKYRQSGQFVIIVPFILMFGLLLGLSLWELKLQGGSRIFLVGENLWDQGQKRALLCLLSYADSHSPVDRQCFQSEIDVVIGDMEARRELDSARPSYPVIESGFERGRNRPSDIPSAVTLYHLKAWNSELSRAIGAWRDTDLYILRLVAIAEKLDRSSNREDAANLKREVLKIDPVLSADERGFAEHLNNGMRDLTLQLLLLQGIAALILISLAILVSSRMMAARKDAQGQVQFLAYNDQLTGLPNRVFLSERLTVLLSAAHSRREKVAVLFLDLDRFKLINDSLGHSVGDILLKEVAERLKLYLRDVDIVARIGGDEFLIVLPHQEDVRAATLVAQRILDAMTVDFIKEGHLFNISCSVGISLFPQHGKDAETLIKNADAAMYCAKEAGRNCLRVFADEMTAEVTGRLNLEKNLRVALEGRELSLVYQPQMDLTTGAITGLEALLRWKHPEMGMIPPDTFIPVAENCGLILPIGEWIVRTACAQAREWHDRGLLVVPIAVNVSAVQFRQEGFCEMIRRIMRETGLAPHLLELELTESLLLSNEDVMFGVLSELKAMGVNLTIDDFGTGYSSLSYLRQFPVKKLKIDRSFIRDVALNHDDAAITSAIISMARKLNLKVIAEGVENQEQVAFLRAQRCDELQGYYFSRPLTPEKLIELLPCFSLETPMMDGQTMVQ